MLDSSEREKERTTVASFIASFLQCFLSILVPLLLPQDITHRARWIILCFIVLVILGLLSIGIFIWLKPPRAPKVFLGTLYCMVLCNFVTLAVAILDVFYYRNKDSLSFFLTFFALSTSIVAAVIIILIACRWDDNSDESLKKSLIVASIAIILSIAIISLTSYNTYVPPNMIPFFGKPEEYGFEQLSDAAYDTKEMDSSGSYESKYPPSNVIDEGGDPWHASKSFGKEEAYIVMQLNQTEKIQIIGFWPGGVRLGNNKPFPTRVRFDFSDGSSVEYEFQPKNELQRVKLSRPVETSHVKITVLDIEPKDGDITKEVCIQHVQLWRVKANK